MRQDELIGLLPAAGRATRLGPLAGSKEMLTVGWSVDGSGKLYPVTACARALEAMRRGGVRRAFVILRDGKWDIPRYLADGSRLDMSVGYLLMGLPHGAPYSLDQAYAFVGGATVVLGFPDILFDGSNVYETLLDARAGSSCDVLLGLFPPRDAAACDRVDVDDRGRVRRIEVKPMRTSLSWTWGIAAWTPRFTEFLHRHLRDSAAALRETAGEIPEAYVGEVIQAAIDDGLSVEGIPVSRSPYLDIGTPPSLREAIRRSVQDLS